MSVRKTPCPVCGKLIPIRKLHQDSHAATHLSQGYGGQAHKQKPPPRNKRGKYESTKCQRQPIT